MHGQTSNLLIRLIDFNLISTRLDSPTIIDSKGLLNVGTGCRTWCNLAGVAGPEVDAKLYADHYVADRSKNELYSKQRGIRF